MSIRRPISVVHDTADGPIYSRVERRGRKWVARHWGEELNGCHEFGSLAAANDYLVRSFRAMFPEHDHCTQRCGKYEPEKA